MGTIIVNPGALMDYADWVRPKVLRVETDTYSSAVSSYLAASPNDFGAGGVTNAASDVGTEVEDVERHNLVAEKFAGAVEALDSDKAQIDDGTVTFQLGHADFLAMKASWATLGDDEDLVEQAEDIQAKQYADDVNAVLADEDMDGEDKRAEIERLLGELEADGIGDDPSAQEAFVVTLGPEGLNSLNDVAARAEAEGSDSWLPPLTQVSEYVATAANRMSESRLREFIGGVNGSVLFMNARLTPWDNQATRTATEHLWGKDDWPMSLAQWPASFVDTMDRGDSQANWDALPTTWRAAAAGLLADNPEVAHEFLTATDDQGRERLRDMVYNVDSAFAGDALVAGLKTWPMELIDPNDTTPDLSGYTSSESAMAWLIDHHSGTDGWGPLDGEDNMNDHSRVALAEVGGLFFDQFQVIADNESLGGTGAFSNVDRGELVYYHDQLFESETAQQVTSQQLGSYMAIRWEEGVGYLADTYPGDPQGPLALGEHTQQIDNLSDVFRDSLIADGASNTEQHNFWIGVSSTVTKSAAGIGIAASPLTAGTSAVAGAGVAFAITQVTDATPVPSFDQHANAVTEQWQAERTAMTVLLEHPDVLDTNDGNWPDDVGAYNLPESTVDLLEGDQIWDDLASDDKGVRSAAQEQLNAIKRDNPTFGTAINQLVGEIRFANEG